MIHHSQIYFYKDDIDRISWDAIIYVTDTGSWKRLLDSSKCILACKTRYRLVVRYKHDVPEHFNSQRVNKYFSLPVIKYPWGSKQVTWNLILFLANECLPDEYKAAFMFNKQCSSLQRKVIKQILSVCLNNLFVPH